MTEPPSFYLPPSGPTPPSGPPEEPDAHRPTPPTGGGGSLWLGFGLSLGSFALVFVPLLLGMGSLDGVVFMFGWPVVLLVAGLVLAGIARTRRTGGGILLGLGVGILVLGGVCVTLLVAA